MLTKGDRVVMHTCREAKRYDGKVWVCESGEYKNPANKQNVIKLKGYSKPFKSKYLQKIAIPPEQVIMPSRDEVQEYLYPKSLVLDPERSTALDRVYNSLLHFYELPEPEPAELGITYFDNRINLSIPVPMGMKVVYENKEINDDSGSFLETLHNLLVDHGIGMKATLEVYFPEVDKIRADCERYGIEYTPFEGGLGYVGPDLNIIVKSY